MRRCRCLELSRTLSRQPDRGYSLFFVLIASFAVLPSVDLEKSCSLLKHSGYSCSPAMPLSDLTGSFSCQRRFRSHAGGFPIHFDRSWTGSRLPATPWRVYMARFDASSVLLQCSVHRVAVHHVAGALAQHHHCPRTP